MAVRVKLNRKAVQQLLKVTAAPLVKERTDRITAKANADSGNEGDFETQMWVGRNRVRGTARTKTARGRWYEAKHRTLSKSLDAGR